jgi:hypothetical protein
MPSPFDLLRNGQGGRGAHPRLSHSRRADPGPAIRQAERQQERDAAAVAPSYFRALKQQAFEKGFEAESEVVAQESKAMAAQQREQEKQAVAAQKAEQQQRNLANETKWRSQGRAIYKNELGDWTPLQDDDTWEAEKKKKADAAAEKARVKSGMESLQALSDGFKIAGHQVSSIADARQASEAAAHAEKYRAADALKTASSALEATQAKHDADAKFPRENLPGAQRALSLADNEARASEAAVKKMTLEGPMAVNREQNMRRVIQAETLKIEQARRDLRAGKGVPWLDALSGAGTAAIAKEAQPAPAPQPPAPKQAPLPPQAADDASLSQRVQDADATLPKRQQDLQARQQQTQATVAKAEQDLAAAEQRLRTTPSTASGYSPVRLADGSEVDYAALKEHEAATEAHQRATEQAEREQEELQLETEAVNASLQQRDEAAQVLNDRATAKRRDQDAALDAQTGQLATRAGFAESATRLQQLDADFRKIRDRESDPNAIQAAFEEYQNHRQGILQEGHQKHEAATSEAMALLKKREARFAELKKSGAFSKGSPQANQQELEAEEGTLTYEIEGLAEKLGIMPEDAMGLYEDAGKLSAPWEDKLNKRAETSRRLSDGRVVVNPSLWADPDAYEKAVQDSQGTEDGKKQALAIMPELRRKAAEEIAKAVSVLPDFKQFLDEQPGSLEDKVAALIREQKRGGALDQAINRMVGGGGSAIAQQALGTLAAMTGFVKDKTGVSLGSDALHRAMQWASDRGRAYETAAQLAATHPAINFGTELLQAGTSLLPAAAGGTAGHVIGGSTKAAVVGSAVAAGGQSFGGTYADAYQKTLQDALTKGAAPQDAERTARAESFTPAVASGILTSILTAGGGAKGVEAMFRSAAGRDVVKRTLATKLREIGIDVAEESLEEGLDELGQGIIAQMSYDPNRSVVSIVEQSVKAAVMGGFLGGAVSTVKTAADGREPSAEAIAMEDAASRSIVDTELSDGTPEATQARVLLDIASGERSLDTLQNDELDAVGLKRDAKGEIKAGKDAVVSVENGKPIILQPALDAMAQRFPAARAKVKMSEVEARAAAKEQTPKDKAQDETATGQPPDVAADAPNDLGNSGAEQGGSSGTGATASSSEGGAIGVESVGEAPKAVAPETPDAPPMEQPTNPRVAPDEAEPGTVLSEPVKPSQGALAQAASEAATSPDNDLPQPTEAQKEAGNYKKGHVALGGLNISIENPAGSKRRPEWPPLTAHYGYIKRSEGADGDQVDVFINPETAPDWKGSVWAVNQTKQDGSFDEHKVLIGYPSEKTAREGYLSNYTKGWKGLGSIALMSREEFSERLAKGEFKKSKPVASVPRGTITAPTPEPEPANLTDRIQRLAKPSVIAATKQGQRQGADVGVQAKLIATAVEREAGKFAGVKFKDMEQGASGVRLENDGTLVLDVPKMLATVQVKSVKEAREWIDAVIDEEFRHRVALELEKQSPEFAADLDAFYDALPQDLKDKVRDAYFAKVNKDGKKRDFTDRHQAKHEAFRMYWQNAEFAKLTESALNSKGFIDTLRKVVAAFIKELRRIAKGANPQVKAVADRLIAMAEKRAGELSKAKTAKPVQPDILAGAGVTPPQSQPSAPTLKSGEGELRGTEKASERDRSKPEQMTLAEVFEQRVDDLPMAINTRDARRTLERDASYLMRETVEKALADVEVIIKSNQDEAARLELVKLGKAKPNEADIKSWRYWEGQKQKEMAIEWWAEDYGIPQVRTMADQLQRARAAVLSVRAAAKRWHKQKVISALDNEAPVSVDAVKAYGIKPPNGYVKEGELYIYNSDDGQPKPLISAAPSGPSSDEDAAYLAAVERGDMETAQRMVALASIADVSDDLSRKDADRFATGLCGEFAFAVRDYLKSGGISATVETGIRNEVDADGEVGSFAFSHQVVMAFGESIDSTGTDAIDRWEQMWSEDALGSEDFQESSFDWIAAKSPSSHRDEYGAAKFDNAEYGSVLSRLKENPLDPVTRDAQGNVIPLSQRFSPESKSILHAAPSGEDSSEDAKALERLAAEASDELTPEQRKILEEFHNLPDADDDTETPDLKAKMEGGTSIKNAVMRAEREERGAEPLPRVIPRQWRTAGRNAQRLLDQEPEAASKLLKLLMADPRAITDNEVALILIYKVRVEQRMERASREMEKHPKDSPENIEAKRDYDHYADELNNIDIAGNLAGTETGRGLNARKMMKARDFSEAALMQAYRTEVKLGERLTEDEIKHVRKVAADIASVMAKIQADETAQLQKQAQAGLQRLTDEFKKKPEKTSKVRRVLADRVKGARERLAAAFSLGAAPSGNAQDAEYLAAVERGDMETAQRMVEDLAIYDDTQRTDIERGIPRGVIEPELRGLFAKVVAAERKIKYQHRGDYGTSTRQSTPQQTAAATRARRAFYAKYKELHPQDEYLEGAADQERAFSSISKPVEFDAQGNVIPLSQRFNPESKSILHAAPSGELSPEVLQDLATVGASYIEDGAKTVEDFTAAMVGEFGERVKPYAASLFRVAQKQHADAAKEATEGAKPEAVLKKARARLGDAPEGELDEALVVALATAYIRQKVSDAQEMVRRITADLKPLYPDVTEEMVRIVFSGYGKTSKPSEDALKKQIAEYKAQLRLVQGQEDVRRGQAPLKSGFQRGAQSATVRGLSQELQDLMRKHGIAHTSEDQLANARKSVVTRLRHQIEDLTRIIDGKAKPRDPKAVVQYDDEMKALLKERNELKQYVDELTGPSPEAKWNQRAQAAARASEEHYRRKIAAGELTTKQGGTHTESPETVKARDDAKKAKREFEALREASGIPQAEALAKTKERLNEAVKEATERLVTGRKAVKGQKPKITDAEAQALEEKLRRLRASIRLVEGGKKWTDTQRAETAAKNIRRQIGNLSERIQANNTTKNPKGDPVPETDELRALKQERAFLWEIYAALEEAKHPRRLPAEIAVDAFRRRVDKMRRDAEAKLKGGEFLETPEEDRVFQKRIEAARFELAKLKQAWNEELLQLKLAQRSIARKTWDKIAEILNTARAIKTSLDFSAMLRQGGFIALGHPIRAAKSVPDMLRAFASERAHHAVMEEIKSRPNFGLYGQSKLYLADIADPDLSKLEENFMGRWANKIPLVAGSQRAFVAFLNKLRADSFDAMMETLGRDGKVTKDEGRALAAYINVATGRGIIGSSQKPQGSPILSTVFFAPRLLASRVNLLGFQPLYGGSMATRELIFKDYLRFAAGIATAIALASLANDDDDPPLVTDSRSSDFMKVRFGNTRVDFFTGLVQPLVFMRRMLSGQTISKGKVVDIAGPNQKWGQADSDSVFMQFLRSKLSPVAAAVWNSIKREDYDREPTTPLKELARLPMPIGAGDIMEVIEEHGAGKGAALSILSMLGAGVQTYDNKKKPAKVAQKPAARPPVRPVMPPRTGANIRIGDWQSRMRQMMAT